MARRKLLPVLIFAGLTIPLLIGAVVLVTKKGPALPELLTISAIIMAVFVGLVANLLRSGERLETDERSDKIDGAAFTFSWYLGVYLVFTLLLANELKFTDLSIQQTLLLVLASMLISKPLLKFILTKKEVLGS